MGDRLTEKERFVKTKTELFSTLASAALLISGQIESAGRHNGNYTNTAFNKCLGTRPFQLQVLQRGIYHQLKITREA